MDAPEPSIARTGPRPSGPRKEATSPTLCDCECGYRRNRLLATFPANKGRLYVWSQLLAYRHPAGDRLSAVRRQALGPDGRGRQEPQVGRRGGDRQPLHAAVFAEDCAVVV